VVNRQARFNPFANLVVALLAALPGAGLAAEAAQSQPPSRAATGPTLELGEVLVQGIRSKPTRDPQKIVNWLKLLVGEFRYSGYVQLPNDGKPGARLQVKGLAECTAFGLAPGVQCTINVIWPKAPGPNGEGVLGGLSTLSPAMIQYGLDVDRLGIRYLQVDNRGHGDYGQGYLVNDTLTTTMPCVDIKGNCQRISRITARPDGKIVDMQIDIEQDETRLVRYKFVLQRVGAVPAGAISGG
jgi:hypothetical protein